MKKERDVAHGMSTPTPPLEGEDARKLLDSLESGAEPEEMARRIEAAKKYLAESGEIVLKPKSNVSRADATGCSFCGKSSRMVTKLVQSRTSFVTICDECVGQCTGLMIDAPELVASVLAALAKARG